MKKNNFDGFSIEIFQEEEKEGGEWISHFEELPGVSASGESPGEALKELQEAWSLMKESYKKHGEPIPIVPSKSKCIFNGF